MFLLENIYVYGLYIAYNVSRSVGVVKFCKLATTKIPYVGLSPKKKLVYGFLRFEKNVRP